jgi:alpha-glucosidase
MAEYTHDERLHMGYSFELLTDEFSAGHIRRTVQRLERNMPHGWPCWAISNHDSVRVRSRWDHGGTPEHFAGQLSALACSLRGSVCVYQGEELGLPEADVPYEALRDPLGLAFWPNAKGRDGCRTPMPWRDAEHGGFTRGEPWLPVSASHLRLSVDRQESQPDSPLNTFRRLMQWRRQHPPLVWGDIRFLEAPSPVLALVRSFRGASVLAMFNLGSEEIVVPLPLAEAQELAGHGLVAGRIEGKRVRLPGYGSLFAALATCPASQAAQATPAALVGD